MLLCSNSFSFLHEIRRELRMVYVGCAFLLPASMSAQVSFENGGFDCTLHIAKFSFYPETFVEINGIADSAFFASDEDSVLRIPAALDYDGQSYPVIVLHDSAFMCYNAIRSVVIEEGVGEIGDAAFMGCANLRSIHIPSTVYSIFETAFMFCPRLCSIEISVDNKYYDSREGSNAIISRKSDVLEVGCVGSKIPQSVKAIGRYAFYWCVGLDSLIVPEGVEKIDEDAFSGCFNLKYVSLPNSLRSLESGAFAECQSLDSIFIPRGVVPSWRTPFAACWRLRRIVVDDCNPYLSSFGDCNVLVDLEHKRLVAGCRTSTIPEGVEEIEPFAFSGIVTLQDIFIPKTVRKIGVPIFCGCNGLSSIVVDAANPNYDSRDGCDGIVETTTNKLIAACPSTSISPSVRSIGYCTFSNIQLQRVLTLPEGLEEIQNSAFDNCRGLHYVLCPFTLKVIRSYAFMECPDLERVITTSLATTIEKLAFIDCPSMPEGFSSPVPNPVWELDFDR